MVWSLPARSLERLQAAGNERLRSRNAAFGSQYELASYLYNFLSSHLKTEDIELRMGNIALLYRLLQRLQLTGLKDITPILRSVKFEKDRRTISQQIIDQIISGNEKRYQCYQELRTEPETASPETLQAVNQFLEVGTIRALAQQDCTAHLDAFPRCLQYQYTQADGSL